MGNRCPCEKFNGIWWQVDNQAQAPNQTQHRARQEMGPKGDALQYETIRQRPEHLNPGRERGGQQHQALPIGGKQHVPKEVLFFTLVHLLHPILRLLRFDVELSS